MAYRYYECKKYLRDPVLIALGFHAYVTGSNPVLILGCEFYLLLSEIQLHHAL